MSEFSLGKHFFFIIDKDLLIYNNKNNIDNSKERHKIKITVSKSQA